MFTHYYNNEKKINKNKIIINTMKVQKNSTIKPDLWINNNLYKKTNTHKKKWILKFQINILFMLTITSYVGLLFAALGFTLALYFGLTKVVKLI